MSDRNYRPDIDGLRAIAVLMVIAFHAGLGVPGGYVGVDIFFVLSGFLITRLALKEIDGAGFSLKDFWLRRICRIVPASTCMVLVVLATGFLLMLRDDYVALGDSAAAQQLMVANAYFWRKMGYFDGPAELRPLLHAWSLAVEEQFYLFYPLLLLGLGRIGRASRLTVLFGLSCASLAVSELTLSRFPSAAFYLLPSRAWELLLGGAVCLVPTPRVANSDRRVEGISWAALAAILWSAATYTSETRFPGLSALVPCAATALLIYVHSFVSTTISQLLAWRPVVWIGQISYSLYLWHWPLLAYGNYVGIKQRFDPRLWLISYLAATAVLAVLSWRFVEQPWRRAYQRTRPAVVFGSFLAGIAAVVVAAAGIRVLDGIPQRLPRVVRNVRQTPYNHELSPAACDRNELPVWRPRKPEKIRVLVWGDSHAMAMMAGVVAACEQRPVTLYQATHSDTPPLLGFVSSHVHRGQAPPALGDAVVRVCRNQRVDLVFMAASWAKYSSAENFEASLERTLRELAAIDVHAVLVADYPAGRQVSPRAVLAAALFGDDVDTLGLDLAHHREKNGGVARIFARHMSETTSVRDPEPAFVNRHGLCGAVAGGKALYVDSSHLCEAGGLVMTDFFGAVIDEHIAAD
jgi:peptidoglycan/LPS O-acetylase OafA/YrhL